jgi:hypothetical protein
MRLFTRNRLALMSEEKAWVIDGCLKELCKEVLYFEDDRNRFLYMMDGYGPGAGNKRQVKVIPEEFIRGLCSYIRFYFDFWESEVLSLGNKIVRLENVLCDPRYASESKYKDLFEFCRFVLAQKDVVRSA